MACLPAPAPRGGSRGAAPAAIQKSSFMGTGRSPE